MIAGLMELLRGGSDSGGQAAARAIKNLSAGHASSAKVRLHACFPPVFYLHWVKLYCACSCDCVTALHCSCVIALHWLCVHSIMSHLAL